MSDEAEEAIARIPANRTLTWCIRTNAPGQRLSAELIGGTIEQVSRLIRTACERFDGRHHAVFLDELRFLDDGGVEADLTPAPIEPPPHAQEGGK
jgi:hypothetical protein